MQDSGSIWESILEVRSYPSTMKALISISNSLKRWICFLSPRRNESTGINEVRSTVRFLSKINFFIISRAQTVSAYEREMQIKLTEMAETVLLIRHKDALDAKKAAELSTEEGAETVKPVFVMGNRISMEYLATQDMDVSERLNGIV